ncbi:hypothetical protein THRCLA_22880 [Thraustotheca clavata]|uniref:Uncharacterized protein n=1 Tax=Thraustotheca clavata TaxID=74557 RepID=A0A1V9YRS6_9STRA|nr:hypothetical protein THRCLA_22880 [Thraustotheca clavata]
MKKRVSRSDGAKVCSVCGSRTRHKLSCPNKGVQQYIVPRSRRERATRGEAFELLSSDEEKEDENEAKNGEKQIEEDKEEQTPRKKLKIDRDAKMTSIDQKKEVENGAKKDKKEANEEDNEAKKDEKEDDKVVGPRKKLKIDHESGSDDEKVENETKKEDVKDKAKKEEEKGKVENEDVLAPQKKLRKIDQDGKSVCSLCGNGKRHKADCTWKKSPK